MRGVFSRRSDGGLWPRIAAMIALVSAGAPGALGQCQEVWTPAAPGDFNGPVRAIASTSFLYAGGEFTEASGQPANHIARGGFGSWQPMGSGTNGTVLGLEAFMQHVYAGGEFTTAGGLATGGLARWNIQTLAWEPAATPPFPGVVFDLAADAGALYAVAVTAGTTAVHRWDGVVWQRVGGMIPWIGQALAVQGSEIFVGGFLPGGGESEAKTARWDGAMWQDAAVPSCCGSGVASMTTFEGDFVLTGFNVVVNRWNGSQWVAIGSGIAGGEAIGEFQGRLVAGSGFFNPQVLAWDGVSWNPLGTGGPTGPVSTIVSTGSRLYVGGVPYTSPSRYMARYGCPCYPDCNNSGTITVADVSCFQTQWVMQYAYGDCNNSGTFTIADFACFRDAMVMGCP